MSRKDLALALLVPCLLGFGFVIAKPAMESFPPILLNGLRWSLSGLLMCYFFPFPKNFIKQMFAISIIGGSVQYVECKMQFVDYSQSWNSPFEIKSVSSSQTLAFLRTPGI